MVDSANEIGSLTTSFNVMTHRIQELMEQNIREQEAKRKSELKALQSQINPHFLYNTLDSIIWMAEGKKNEEVVLMTASLARLLRQSISNEDEVISIGQEIEYARGYLTIQKMRYKDKMEFRIDVEPSILNIRLIKLVLQPIIENAIYHGLKYKESKGLLLVKGFLKDGNAVIQVIDDGVGMEPEVLEHIFEKHKVNYRSNGVGVYNVQKRLQLYYGSEYGITYESEKERARQPRSPYREIRRTAMKKYKMDCHIAASLGGGSHGRNLLLPQCNWRGAPSFHDLYSQGGG